MSDKSCRDEFRGVVMIRLSWLAEQQATATWISGRYNHTHQLPEDSQPAEGWMEEKQKRTQIGKGRNPTLMVQVFCTQNVIYRHSCGCHSLESVVFTQGKRLQRPN